MKQFFVKNIGSFVVIIFILTGCLITSCYYDSKEFLYPQLGNNCDTTNITYSQTIGDIMDQYCVSCHNSATASGNVKLDSYQGVKSVVDNGKLYPSISYELTFPMPPSGKISDCSISSVKKWIDAGAPNI